MENQKSTQLWPKMDLVEGEVKTYFSLAKNDIYTQRYSMTFSTLLSIAHAIFNPPSLILIVTLIIVCIFPYDTPYPISMYATELAIIILASFTRNFLISRTKAEADSRINHRTVKAYRGSQEHENMEWGQLQQGDIVYLMQGEAAPADLVILDSQQIEHREAITYVDVKNLNGETVCQKKKACYLTQILNRSSTQKRVWQEYKKIISGRITYEKPTAAVDSFTGYLKLTKDPKVEKLSIENLVLRESVVKTSLWIYGLVIYPGMESKVMRNFKEGNTNRQWVITLTHQIFIGMLGLNLILGLIFTLLFKYSVSSYHDNVFVVSYHFLMFSVLLPHLLFLAEDLLLITLKFSNKTPEMDVRDYSNIQQIGEISYAVMSNVGVLTSGKLEVNEIVTESSVYSFVDDNNCENEEVQKNTGLNGRRVGSSVRCNGQGSKQVQNKFLLPIMNYDRKASALVFRENEGQVLDENFEIDDDTNIRLRQMPSSLVRPSKLNTHLEPLKLDRNRFYNYVKRNENQSTQIIKAIGLCHQAKLNYDSAKDRYEGVSNVNSEEVLLKLVNYVGWSIMPKLIDKKEVGVTIFEEKEKMNDESGLFNFETVKKTYYWSGVNSFNIPRKLFSVVVTQERQNTLYCKGRPEDIMERLKLSKQTQKIIEQTIATYSKKQSQIIIYARRELSEEERQIYENDYISLKSSLTTTESEIEQFSKRYEKNLEFICIIGLSTQISPQSEPLVKYIRDLGIKPCIFTHEKSETTSLKKLICQQGEDCKDIELQGESAELIRYYLNQATSLLNNKQQFKYIVTVNGKAWQVIRSNSCIMQHFMFVLYHAEATIGIRFRSEDIAELTHRLRTSFPDDQKVLGIGYSYTDLKYLGESDLSISTCQDLPTDIKVQSLSKITQILKLGPGILMMKLCKNSVVLYRVIVMSTITLIYQIMHACYSTSQTINGYLVFHYCIVYSFLELLYTMFNYRSSLREEDETKYRDFRQIKKKFYTEYIEAVVHGAMIILSLHFNMSAIKVDQGKLLPIEALDLAVFITLILVGSLRNGLNESFSKMTYFVTTLITLSVMSLCTIMSYYTSTKFQKIALQIVTIGRTYDSVISILNCTIFCLAVSYFLEEVIKKNILFAPVESVKATESKNKKAKKNMSRIISHLFQSEQNMETSLKEIVTGELDVNQFKISTFLSIKNEEENLKFMSQRIKKNRLTMIKILSLLAPMFLLIMLLNVLVVDGQFQQYQAVCVVGFLLSLAALVFLCMVKQLYMSSYYLVGFITVIIATLWLVYDFESNDTQNFMLICGLAVILTQDFTLNFFALSVLLIVLVVCGIATAAVDSGPLISKILYPFFEAMCVLVNFFLYYQVEKLSMISFVNTQSFEKESNYANDILSILVPKFIKNHLQGNDFSLQQEQKKVSILFCYVCNFDQIVKEEGTNVVSLMDELFRQFDQLCHNYAVQKIETVGQTYMAATGIKAYEDEIETDMKKKNQVERLLKMGIQMLEKSKDIMWGTKKNKKLNIKIGIHHGNVMIGVIGFHKPQFSLIGDTVNTTSRHCSTAGPGQIVVSYVAYELLTKFPASSFTKSKKNMKGLGEVPVYKYNNDLGKEQKHLRTRIKFQSAVRKVIEQLKKDGKIKYKKFDASKFAERAMLRERLNTKKLTKLSQPRKSLQLSQGFILDAIREQKQTKYNQSCIKYNKWMELEEKSLPFKKHIISKHLSTDRLSICLLALIFLVSYVIDIATNNYQVQSLALASIGLVLFPLMFIMYKSSIKRRIIKLIYILFYTYLIIVINLNSILLYDAKSAASTTHIGDFYGIMTVLICSWQKSFRFIHTLVLAVVCLVVSVATLAINNHFSIDVIYEFFVLAFIVVRKYSHLKEYYENYNQAQIYEKKTQEQSALVSQLLPKHAYQKLKNQNIENKLELTDRFEGATILFADIKGFTSYSNKNSPAQVVKMLRELFEQFDKLCLKYNVYKVYTIGDCYVVLGFTNCYQRDYLQEAKNVINMGLAMVETIQRVREALDFPDLDMRIGIHTGTIIGGIIGTEIVRYDIYGPDVMVANKFEEYGKTGFIHISEATKEILDQDKKKSFNIVANGVVKVEKLNAEYNGYILTKKKFQI